MAQPPPCSPQPPAAAKGAGALESPCCTDHCAAGRRKWPWPAAIAGAAALLAAPSLANASDATPASTAIFLAQLIALLLVGRLLGELSQRVGQPPVVGQLLAGVVLGPSVLGSFWPAGEHWLFPASAAQHGMLDAIAQLGVLMLLLLTGMETKLSIVGRVRRAATCVTLFGIGLPFAGGLALGALLPDSMLPGPGSRLLTALFLGTALSISSVKIVAAVIRELDFTHRRVGEVMLAAAVLDDTLGWIILAAIFGLARNGRIDVGMLGRTVVGTMIFLVLSFTLGRRAVTILIRWSNDHLRSEMAVVTTILLVMGILAFATDALGLHTVLGAFVAGMLVGQSPILTGHIDQQLRGLITALFMPVFFGLAGLSADLGALRDPTLAVWAAAFVLAASLGKFGGALIGGRLGGLTLRESLAVGCGMNARGSTEIIIATLGLAMGALTPVLFTLIVTMAILTTLAMPPTLRFALRHLPTSAAEELKLEQRDFESDSYVSHLERLLLAVDDSASGRLASRLVGLLAGARGMPTTVVPLKRAAGRPADRSGPRTEVTDAADQARAGSGDGLKSAVSGIPVHVANVPISSDTKQAIATEARKGFDLLWVGMEPVVNAAGAIHDDVTRAVAGFDGPFAIVASRTQIATVSDGGRLAILLAVTGTAYSRRATEIALALAHASGGIVTALYVEPSNALQQWRDSLGVAPRAARPSMPVFREVLELGRHYNVDVRTQIKYKADAGRGILEALKRGPYDLLVMGVTARPNDTIFFGPVPAAVLAGSPRSVLLIAT